MTTREISYTKEIRIAARKYAESNKPKTINSFITYLHETFKPDSQRKTWIHQIELNDMEPRIKRIIQERGES